MTTILIVDDEVDIAETLQMYLEIGGYDTLVAFDGLDALHKSLEHRPNLIITDMMMPRMDGAELIRRVHETPALQRTPIISMSGKARRTDLPFFRKPFDPEDLMVAIRDLVGEPG